MGLWLEVYGLVFSAHFYSRFVYLFIFSLGFPQPPIWCGCTCIEIVAGMSETLMMVSPHVTTPRKDCFEVLVKAFMSHHLGDL